MRELLRLSAKVAARMRSAGVCGRTVTLKVRFHDFTTITRSRTLRDATNLTPEIYATAADLFAALGLRAGPDPAGRGPRRRAGRCQHSASAS